MRRYSLLLILMAGLVFASCQSTSRTARVESDLPEAQSGPKKLIGFPKEVVWSAMEDLLRARGWIITMKDRENGTMYTSYADVPNGSNYARCSGGRQSSLSDYRAQLEITLKRVSADGTDVTIASTFEAADAGRRESQTRIECSSNGQLEAELFAGVDSVVAARK